jgi:hypothetical protein
MKYLTLPCKNCITLAICKSVFMKEYIKLKKSGRPLNVCTDMGLTRIEAKCSLLLKYLNETGSGNPTSEYSFFLRIFIIHSKRSKAERFFIDTITL